MLFETKPDGSESLYIGLCNSDGKPHNDPGSNLKGLYFSNLDFTDECLTSHKSHPI